MLRFQKRTYTEKCELEYRFTKRHCTTSQFAYCMSTIPTCYLHILPLFSNRFHRHNSHHCRQQAMCPAATSI